MAAVNDRSSFMLARLERETRDCHAIAEADLYRVLDEPTLAGYRRLLAAIYHFEYAFESRLVYVADLQLRFVATRLRSGALAQDLAALGIDQSVLAIFSRPAEVPALTSPIEALAWTYVVQRNTLHHGELYRVLARRARPALQVASRYLTAYANNVYERWHELGAHLDHVASSVEAARELTDAARDAFARQHRWHVAAAAPSSVHVALSV